MDASKNEADRRARARRAARLLLEMDAVRIRAEEPFQLTSGRLSPVYVDCRRIPSFPAARTALLQDAAAALGPALEACDLIAGGETAGIAPAALLAGLSGKPMVYVRKAAKSFGRARRIEGAFAAGQKVLLVEDMMTDGGSKAAFVEALEQEGLVCRDLFVFFRYGIGGAGERRLAELGVKVHALATWDDLLAEAGLEAERERAVRAFLKEVSEEAGKEAGKGAEDKPAAPRGP